MTVFLLLLEFILSVPGIIVLIILGATTFAIGRRAKQPIYKYSLYLTSSFVILSPAIGLLLFFTILPSTLDDDPFEGTVRANCPSGLPKQIFPINLGRTLEVFDRSEGDPAPTVLLKRRDQSVAWCIFATGDTNTNVRELSFSSYSESKFSQRATAIGIVDWTFGAEQMTWKIDRDDDYAYWYSW